MNLKLKSNQELLSTLKLQVENERKLLMEILYSLQEVEVRSLHLEMGYPDLYTFAMKELGYSSGSAYRRISAMRLLKSVPVVASAELMSKLEELKDIFAHQNFEGRMDALVDHLADIALQKFRPASVRKPAALRKLASSSKPALEADSSSPALGMTSTQRNTSSSTSTHNKPVKTDQKRAPSNQKSSLPKRSRYIPAQIRRQVLLRDQNGCTFKDPKTGRVCGAKRGIQFDHMLSFHQSTPFEKKSPFPSSTDGSSYVQPKRLPLRSGPTFSIVNTRSAPKSGAAFTLL